MGHGSRKTRRGRREEERRLGGIIGPIRRAAREGYVPASVCVYLHACMILNPRGKRAERHNDPASALRCLHACVSRT